MSDLFEPTLAEQIHEVEREMALRQSVYPRWIASGQLKQERADRQQRALRAVLKTLLRLQGDTA